MTHDRKNKNNKIREVNIMSKEIKNFKVYLFMYLILIGSILIYEFPTTKNTNASVILLMGAMAGLLVIAGTVIDVINGINIRKHIKFSILMQVIISTSLLVDYGYGLFLTPTKIILIILFSFYTMLNGFIIFALIYKKPKQKKKAQ